METQERQYVLDNLGASETRLLQLTEGLTPEQWSFRESPERWSIAENLEHCILVENGIAAVIAGALQSPSHPEKRAEVAGKEKHVKGVGDPRGREIVAVEALRPTGRWGATDELRAEMRRVRARSVAFATETDAELRDHFYPHQAMGDLDCYQWLVVMSQHGERHARQIEAVKASPGFPL